MEDNIPLRLHELLIHVVWMADINEVKTLFPRKDYAVFEKKSPEEKEEKSNRKNKKGCVLYPGRD